MYILIQAPQILPPYHFHEAKQPSPLPHIPITFLHGGTLLAGHIKLQGGVCGCRGQVQAPGFVSTNETDSDSEAFPWAPNYGLDCSGHHCGRVRARGQESGGKGRAGTRGGALWGLEGKLEELEEQSM